MKKFRRLFECRELYYEIILIMLALGLGEKPDIFLTVVGGLMLVLTILDVYIGGKVSVREGADIMRVHKRLGYDQSGDYITFNKKDLV